MNNPNLTLEKLKAINAQLAGVITAFAELLPVLQEAVENSEEFKRYMARLYDEEVSDER
jgi:hypothetical protein